MKPSLQIQFQTEKLSRSIQECEDIEILRAIAIELLQLHQKKSAIAQWATERAAEAENRLTSQHSLLRQSSKDERPSTNGH